MARRVLELHRSAKGRFRCLGYTVDLRDRWVHFRMGSVYHPEPRDLAMRLHENDLLQGRVIGFSDSGEHQRAFAIVELEGLDEPVFLPLDSILGVL